MPGFQSILDDFFELSSDRAFSQSVGPIPAASIERRMTSMLPGWAGIYRHLMRAMDGAYLRWMDRRMRQHGSN